MEDANLANGTDGYDNVFVRDMEETKNHRTECECDACYNDWLEYQKYPFGEGGARRCIAENEKLKELNVELEAKANSWDQIHEKYKDHKGYLAAEDKLYKDGCYGSASVLIEFVDNMQRLNAELVKALERIVMHHTVSDLTDLGCQEIKSLIKEARGKL